ncbi:HD domain-containing phosphohydrolase [Polynucleobacter alcilacus]|uniref:HD domain-containing phosphohydrolase n=1 Tax=Polynucleobacter alcilacus TaxID=1819739 RepID=UPI001C0AB6F7|nr:HD domain-containing phosphohydrolase [Polynucleobacter alcilacus]MBU3566590.1 HD domain-containing protein [Polynucleobacter alcilacus]
MDLFNKAFYLSFGLIVLVIYLGTLTHEEVKFEQKAYSFWPIALLLMVTSCAGFFLAGYQPIFFLAVANTSLVFSALAIVLFIRSWDSSNFPIRLRGFWIAYGVFLIFYEIFRIYGSFEARVYFMTSILGLTSLAALVELYLIPKNERSKQFIILKIAFFTHLCIIVLRVVGLTLGIAATTAASTIYQEGPFTAMLRVLGVCSNLLIYLAIGNILLEKVWRKEERKSADNELIMLSSLNALAQARDNETGAHIVRTQAYARRIAWRLRQQGDYVDQLSDRAIDRIHGAAPLHDIGKVGIPDSILYKDGPLSKEEWSIMKSHALIGETVLESAKSQLPNDGEHEDDVIDVAIKIAGEHHEQWDGGGYPRGLAGANISLPARIMSIVDMYDALISKRVYKEEWTHDDAVNEIVAKKGSHFDPLIVQAFVLEQDHFKEIAQRHKDEGVEYQSFRTAPHTVEQKLRHSEERFEFLFKHSPIGMAMVDHATGDFVEVNEALLHYTQYSKEEFLNLSFWDITPKEYEKQEQEQMEDLNRVGSFGPNYKEYIRKDGSRFPISIRGFILSDVDGRKLVWGIIEDLSKKSS